MSLRSTTAGLFASVSQKDLAGDCPVVRGLPEGLVRYTDGASQGARLDDWEATASGLRRNLEFDLIPGLAALGVPTTEGYRIGPYNELTEAVDPATGETVHLVGLYFRSQRADRDAHLLVRRGGGTYEHVLVPSPDGRPLRGLRTIAVSPWPSDQGRVLYLGGFDAHAGPHTGTAWILRAELPR